MKVLNLYAGIGGNRKLWTDVEVTAVELNPEIAKIYSDFFPQDKMIIADAHEYLLKHFKEYDFIWSSPPCPTHSRARYWRYGKENPVYPDMKLYEEIIFLIHHCKTLWCVENVIGYYKPMYEPIKLNRHYFWSNLEISFVESEHTGVCQAGELKRLKEKLGFDINDLKLLRNCTEPELGLHILNCARGIYQFTKDHNQLSLL